MTRQQWQDTALGVAIVVITSPWWGPVLYWLCYWCAVALMLLLGLIATIVVSSIVAVLVGLLLPLLGAGAVLHDLFRD